jgi:hypothetical protein
MVNEHISHRDDFTPANLYYEVTLGTRKGGHLKRSFIHMNLSMTW